MAEVDASIPLQAKQFKGPDLGAAFQAGQQITENQQNIQQNKQNLEMNAFKLNAAKKEQEDQNTIQGVMRTVSPDDPNFTANVFNKIYAANPIAALTFKKEQAAASVQQVDIDLKKAEIRKNDAEAAAKMNDAQLKTAQESSEFISNHMDYALKLYGKGSPSEQAAAQSYRNSVIDDALSRGYFGADPQKAQQAATAMKQKPFNAQEAKDMIEHSKERAELLRTQAQTREQEALAKLHAKQAEQVDAAANSLTPEGSKLMADLRARDPAHYNPRSKVSMADMNRTVNEWAASGRTADDIIKKQQETAGAKSEKQSEGTTVGRRIGTISMLEKELPKERQIVLDALKGVDRTNFPSVNKAIAEGKTAFGSPEESAYAAAIQTFVNGYSRVVGGGSSVVSDSARKEAHDLLSRAQSPAQVQAVLNILVDKELKAAKEAADEAKGAVAGKKAPDPLGLHGDKEPTNEDPLGIK